MPAAKRTSTEKEQAEKREGILQRKKDIYTEQVAASLVPAAKRTSTEKEQAEKRERNLNHRAELSLSKRIQKLKTKALAALRYYNQYLRDMNEMKLEQLKDLLIYIIECINEGESASKYFLGKDAKSATIARLKLCGDDLNVYIY